MKQYINTLNNISPPPMLYGTAWKENVTHQMVTQALTQGFEGIDTANQRKHYFEEGVGLGIQHYLKSSDKTRNDLFIQTKFTPVNGQDHRKPYDEFDSLTNQVQQSFVSSLEHLQTDYIDSYLLHAPTQSSGIRDADIEIWNAMETLVCQRKVHYIGISNVTIKQLEALCRSALVSIKPAFVQNRCFAASGWDKDVRLFCKKNNIIYQGFSLLTANQPYILMPYIVELAKRYNKTIPQIIFRFAFQIGILSLTSTTNLLHMKDDLNINDFELSLEEILNIEQCALPF